jgi:hypothetical protein
MNVWPTKPHGGDRINGDRWCNLTYHEAAMRLARLATTQYLGEIFTRLPGLASHCGVAPESVKQAVLAGRPCE